MSCSNCSAEFGLFKKEIGCENCGFAFCSKCCKKQAIPTECGEIEKKHVCNACCMKLTGKEPTTNRGSPPLAHKKRMEALKKQSYSVDSATHARLHSESCNVKDKELYERLQKLRRDRVKVELPSERDIEVRLAKLKGMDPSRYNAPPIEVYRPPDKRTSIEQANDLMNQITEEVNLDSKIVKPEDEIAARLAALRGETQKPKDPVTMTASNENNPEEMDIESEFSSLEEQSRDLSLAACKKMKELNSNPEYKKLLSSMKPEKETKSDEDDEEEADKLVAQLLASNMHEDLDDLGSPDQSSEKSSIPSEKEKPVEEFPWCVICTDDAKIRCFGCDQDLYCLRCYSECHDSLDIKDHKTCPFLKPKVPIL